MSSSENWTITTLDDGPQTITVSVGAERVNLRSSLKATSPGSLKRVVRYYVGAGLLGVVGAVLLGLLVMFMRNGRRRLGRRRGR